MENQPSNDDLSDDNLSMENHASESYEIDEANEGLSWVEQEEYDTLQKSARYFNKSAGYFNVDLCLDKLPFYLGKATVHEKYNLKEELNKQDKYPKVENFELDINPSELPDKVFVMHEVNLDFPKRIGDFINNTNNFINNNIVSQQIGHEKYDLKHNRTLLHYSDKKILISRDGNKYKYLDFTLKDSNQDSGSKVNKYVEINDSAVFSYNAGCSDYRDKIQFFQKQGDRFYRLILGRDKTFRNTKYETSVPLSFLDIRQEARKYEDFNVFGCNDVDVEINADVTYKVLIEKHQDLICINGDNGVEIKSNLLDKNIQNDFYAAIEIFIDQQIKTAFSCRLRNQYRISKVNNGYKILPGEKFFQLSLDEHGYKLSQHKRVYIFMNDKEILPEDVYQLFVQPDLLGNGIGYKIEQVSYSNPNEEDINAPSYRRKIIRASRKLHERLMKHNCEEEQKEVPSIIYYASNWFGKNIEDRVQAGYTIKQILNSKNRFLQGDEYRFLLDDSEDQLVDQDTISQKTIKVENITKKIESHVQKYTILQKLHEVYINLNKKKTEITKKRRDYLQNMFYITVDEETGKIVVPNEKEPNSADELDEYFNISQGVINKDNQDKLSVILGVFDYLYKGTSQYESNISVDNKMTMTMDSYVQCTMDKVSQKKLDMIIEHFTQGIINKDDQDKLDMIVEYFTQNIAKVCSKINVTVDSTRENTRLFISYLDKYNYICNKYLFENSKIENFNDYLQKIDDSIKLIDSIGYLVQEIYHAIDKVSDNDIIGEVSDNDIIGEVSDNAIIGIMMNSVIGKLRSNTTYKVSEDFDIKQMDNLFKYIFFVENQEILHILNMKSLLTNILINVNDNRKVIIEHGMKTGKNPKPLIYNIYL